MLAECTIYGENPSNVCTLAYSELFFAKALTATATHRVQTDILENLYLRNPVIAKSTFARPNLSYSVVMKSKEGALSDLLPVLRPPDGTSPPSPIGPDNSI